MYDTIINTNRCNYKYTSLTESGVSCLVYSYYGRIPIIVVVVVVVVVVVILALH